MSEDEALWRTVRAMRGASAGGLDLRSVSPGPIVPLSSAQQRLWQLHQLDPERTGQHLCYVTELDGPLDLAALREAILGVWAAHDGLRVRFTDQGGPLRQERHPREALELEFVDLREHASADDEARARARTLVDAAYDFARPLMRAAVYRVDEQRHYLAFGFHHLVYDAWSQDLLLRELGARYRAARAGQEPKLPKLRTSYAAYATWEQLRMAQASFIEPLRAYWREQLRGSPGALQLPQVQAGQPGPCARVRRELEPERCEALRELAAQLDVSLFAVLLAGFSAVLHELTGRADFTICSPVAVRPRGVHYLIGYFVNLVLLRADLFDDPSFAELIRRSDHTALDAQAHHELPIRELAAWTKSGTLSSILFGLQNTPGYPLELDGLSARSLHLPAGQADFDLYLNFEPIGRGLRLVADHDSERLANAELERLIDRYVELLTEAGSRLDHPLSSLTGRPAVARPSFTADDDAEAAARSKPARDGELRARVDEADEPAALLEEFIVREVAWLLRCDHEQVDVARSLLAHGVSSLTLIELASTMSRGLALDVPISDFVRSPSISSLARELVLRVRADELRVGPKDDAAAGDREVLYL